MRLVYANHDTFVYSVDLASGAEAYMVVKPAPKTEAELAAWNGGFGFRWKRGSKPLQFIKRRPDGKPHRGMLGGQKYIEAYPYFRQFRISTMGDKTWGLFHGRGLAGKNKGDYIEGKAFAVPTIVYEKDKSGSLRPITKYTLRVKIDRATGIMRKASRKAMNISTEKLTAEEAKNEVSKMLKSTLDTVTKLSKAHTEVDQKHDPFEGQDDPDGHDRQLHFDAMTMDEKDGLLDLAEGGEIPYKSKAVYAKHRRNRGLDAADDLDDDEDDEDDDHGIAADPSKIRQAVGQAHIEEYRQGRSDPARDGEWASVSTAALGVERIELADQNGEKRTLLRVKTT